MVEIPFRVVIDGDVARTRDGTQIIAGNGGMSDAFGRLRVSEPFTLFDSKQIHDSLPDVYDDQEVSGTGTTSVYQPGLAATRMTVADNTAGRRVRQSYQKFNYQPGKSKQFMLTYCPRVAPTGGSGYRVGTYDDANGLYVQYDAIGYAICITSSVTGTPVPTVIYQEDWNIDHLDGTGASGITLDPLSTQIFMVDYEWLGVGSVRYGFIVNGVPYYCHAQHHANIEKTVYMSTPNLPVRYEVYNDGTGNALELDHICSTVISEGGQTEYGRRVGISRGISSVALSTPSNTWYPLISVRQRAGRLDSVIKVLEGSIATDGSDGVIEISLFRNPGINGTDAASWVVVPNTSIEYDISRDLTNTLDLTAHDENYGIATLAVTSGGGGATSGGVNIPALGSAIDGTQDEFVYAVRRVDGTGTIEVYASIVYRELL